MHLLVVEDDPRLSRVLKRLLEEDRHVVEVANDGASGLEIAEDAPGLEAVILDIGLPDMSGLDVIARARHGIISLRRSNRSRITRAKTFPKRKARS